jgi:two-component system CheB/CheR fusion protein
LTSGRDARFEALLDHLRRTREIDLSGYKRSSLMRRVSKRLRMAGVEDTLEYVDYLEAHPEEYPLLLDTILVNVTSFFRDQPTWEYLGREIVPRILEPKGRGDALRVWSAGCASGEEVYTLAMILAEALGVDAFIDRVRIYASDVDEDALAQARAASYREVVLDSVPEAMRRKYFIRRDRRFVFREDLRPSIIFGRHDLVQDAPIPRLDLLTCRNTLMYLDTATQGSILTRFHRALTDAGYLLLGEAEILLTHRLLFIPADLAYRVFSKTPGTGVKERPPALTAESEPTVERAEGGRRTS